MSNKRKGCGWGVIATVVVVVAAVVAYWGYRYVSDRYSDEPTRIFIDDSTGAEGLRDSLISRLGDEYGEKVYNLWKKLDDDGLPESGSYMVKKGEKAWKLARRIRNRQQDPVRVTFNNLRTMAQLGSSIDAQLKISSDDFLNAVDSVLSARDVKKPKYPAFFLPDTYEFYWTATPTTVVDKLVGQYDRFWNDDRTAKASKLGLEPYEVATLASIVEEETGKMDERPKVARLYLNRLKIRMKLQADPTVKFAKGDFSIRRITRDMLSIDSPYNTYRYAGLPPGPIRIPAASTLDAVLNAPQHDYIYMCAKEDFSGYHNFSSSYEEHQKNGRRYRAELDRRGIK